MTLIKVPRFRLTGRGVDDRTNSVRTALWLARVLSPPIGALAALIAAIAALVTAVR